MEKKKIFIIDDDQRLARTLTRYLEPEGFLVKSCFDTETALNLLENFQPDIVLLDLNFPDGNGLELAKGIRKYSNMGIIVISGTQEEIDKIVSLEIGADDFLGKPLNMRELLARVRTLLRRMEPVRLLAEKTGSSEVHQFNGWILDLNSHELTDPDHNPVPLTTHEFKILSLFLSKPNCVLSRDQILDHMGNRQWTPIDRSIDVMVGKLRKKLTRSAETSDPILTVRGEGYKFLIK